MHVAMMVFVFLLFKWVSQFGSCKATKQGGDFRTILIAIPREMREELQIRVLSMFDFPSLTKEEAS